jgi:hypothetical protein
MSTATYDVVATGRPTVASALVPQEARRLLLHPLMLAGFGLMLLTAWGQARHAGPWDAFDLVDSTTSFFPGLLAILAADLLATRDLRAGSSEALSALPGRPVDRVLAQGLGGLAPAGVALLVTVGLHAFFVWHGSYFVEPDVWQVLQGPVTVLGACLFGQMVGIWLPYRGAGVLSMVALVVLNAEVNGHESLAPLGFMISWPAYGFAPHVWAGQLPGSPAWHVAYLVGLCGLALAASLLKVAGPRRSVVALGTTALVLAVVGGLLQLP